MRTLRFILLAPFHIVFFIVGGVLRWVRNLGEEIKVFFSEEPEDSPLPDALAKTVENPYGLLVHLDALRKHLLRAVALLAIATSLSFYFTPTIIDFLASPIGGIEQLIVTEVTEQIGTFMRVALLSGFTASLPYIVLELWLFIAPGVSRRARLWGLLAIPATVVLFLSGMLFAYYVMMPAALPFLLGMLGVEPLIKTSSYIGFVTNLLFWIGLMFEFPLVIFVLAGIGLVKPRMLAQQWRLAIVIIAILSAVITPTIDPVSMTLVMGPLIVLYFASIGLAYLAQRGRSTA